MYAWVHKMLDFFSELQVKFKTFWIVIVTYDFWDMTVLSKGEWSARKQSVFKHSVSTEILFVLFVTSATSMQKYHLDFWLICFLLHH